MRFGNAAISADGATAVVGIAAPLPDGGAWVYSRSAAGWSLQAKLSPAGAIGEPYFGSSVAVSADGSTIALGGIGDNANAGATWVFTRTGAVWTQQAKLVGSGPAGAANQGFAVALSADGATLATSGPNNGTVGIVWVFNRANSAWTESARLTSVGRQMGISLAMSGDGNSIVAGDPSYSGGPGAAWVYARSSNTWSQTAFLYSGANGTDSGMGGTAAISGDGSTVLLGGQLDSGQVGAAWAFVRSGSSWTLAQKLTGRTATGKSRQGAGLALSADGNTAVIGGPQDNSRGAIWTWTRANGQWSEQSKLTDDSSATTQYFGQSVALSADALTMLAVGRMADFQPGLWLYSRIGPAATETTLSLSSTTLTYGDPIAARATVRPTTGAGVPTGTVSLRNGAVEIASATLVSGVATFSAPALPAGTHSNLTARYSGDTLFLPSVSAPAPTLTIQKAPTVLAAPVLVSGSPAIGQAITIRAVVPLRGAPPAGRIRWYDNGAFLAAAYPGSDGSATLTTAALTLGDHAIAFSFDGDDNYSPAPLSPPLQVTVRPGAPADVSVTGLLSVGYGSPFVVMAVFRGNPSYPVGGSGVTVTFVDASDGGAVLCANAPVSIGMASCLVDRTLKMGVHSIAISELRGDPLYVLGTVSPLNVRITVAPTSTQIAPPATAVEGAAIVTAQVAVIAPAVLPLGGTVSFTAGGAPVAGCQNLPLNTQGAAACALPGGPGQYDVRAVYSGDAITDGSAGFVSVNLASNPRPVHTVNGASYAIAGSVASAEIIAIFGSDLVDPGSDAAVTVTDSAGEARAATVLYAGPTQVNCVLPDGIAPGGTLLAIRSGAGAATSAALNVAAIAPGLFSADASGKGVAAANVQTVHADGSSSIGNAAASAPIPIDLSGPGDQVYVTLYGTGLRGASGLGAVSATIHGIKIPVLYIGATPGFAGLDQVNVGPLPRSLSGAGEVPVTLTIDGLAPNTVTLAFR